ncbi:type ISP restriction/modification enzyme [Deinococcus fonticola]|uniref:type ISP restriction/modification enzyme n=1 Tax=Deinococcus fonticola TaxID=2528713 RepID=UPI0010754033|nr:type ISP restriction/modification enzyme [Deinococcus fonticola]
MVKTPRTAFGDYVKAIRKVHGKGTPENTYLPLLKELLDALLPEYEVITHPSKDEQGLPDFGLREKDGAENVALGEAEALDVPLAKNVHGLEQARRYARQKPTLLTNFHEFVVLEGETELGRYTIPHADLTSATTPADLAKTHLDELSALLSVWASARGSLTRPQKIAGLLAYYARQAMHNLEGQDADALAPLRKAMEDALGTSFTLPKIEKNKKNAEQQRREEAKWAEKQAELDHFFRSSLVQALFYGLFAGWVAAARTGKGAEISRGNIADDLNIPVISLLLDEVNTSRKLTRLDLRALVDRALDMLRRVDAEPFLKSFQEGAAVTYFYEPFLEAFDAQLKKDLGIWYTPHEIIRYQIRHVHGLLQTHLNLPLGLLDPNVTILDPATGTGGYLLELGRFLTAEMQKEGKGRVGARLKEAFQTRIYGFELMPAPFAIAHLQLALLLSEAGAPLNSDERVGVYLTNSLNGWEPRKTKPDPLYGELAEEQELTDEVKHHRKIMVMIGNPPYARFADMPDNPEELALVAPYKTCLRESWGVKKQLLDDLYIRFIRLAEWRIAENTQAGIVSFITNRSYLTGISHPVMREHLLKRFDHLYIDDLHGNQRAHKAGDGSVFTTDTSGGIKVGVAVGTFVKLADSPPDTLAQVHYRDYEGSGESKRQALLEEATPYEPAFTPSRKHRYILKPLNGEDAYWDWPSVDEIFPMRFSGAQAARDGIAVSFLGEGRQKAEDLADELISDASFIEKYAEASLERDGSLKGRNAVIGNEIQRIAVQPYLFRPFDLREVLWDDRLLIRDRPEYLPQISENAFLIASQVMEKFVEGEEGAPLFDRVGFSNVGIEFHHMRPDARAIPLRLRFKHFASDEQYEYLPNISDFYDDLARAGVLKVATAKAGSTCLPRPKPAPVLSRYGVVRDEKGRPNALAWELAEQVFYHALAVLSAPSYRAEHAEYLAEDWPRVPLPGTRAVLAQGAELGRRVAALLDPQAQPDVPRSVGRLVTPGTDMEAPEAELNIGVKPRYDAGREVYVLSDTLELAGVSEAVWGFTLGGYPVLKNWVEYRKGRKLTLDEADWLESIVRRVQGLLNLGPELDAGYTAAKATGDTAPS